LLCFRCYCCWFYCYCYCCCCRSFPDQYSTLSLSHFLCALLYLLLLLAVFRLQVPEEHLSHPLIKDGFACGMEFLNTTLNTLSLHVRTCFFASGPRMSEDNANCLATFRFDLQKVSSARIFMASTCKSVTCVFLCLSM